MTNREFYTLIANNENLQAEIVVFAQNAIEKLDARNRNRSSKPSKTAIANEPIKMRIREYLTDKTGTASEIAVALEITTQKASALCRQLVEDGILTKSEVKIPKKGVQKAYTLAK